MLTGRKIMSYYKNQLNKLTTDSIYAVTVKLVDPNGKSTKFMDLNLESIPELIAF